MVHGSPLERVALARRPDFVIYLPGDLVTPDFQPGKPDFSPLGLADVAVLSPDSLLIAGSSRR